MHVELSVALNFIISHLYNKLPRRRVDVFAEELENGFRIRFQGHWYPEEPSKGSGFRCVKIAEDKVDPVVDAAARSSGLDITEIKSYLPSGLTVWIDPNEVSYRVGEYGHVQVLYRRLSGSTNCSAADGGLIDDVSSGFDNGAPSSNWTGSSGGGFCSEQNLLAAAAAPGLALKLNPIGTTFNGNGDHSPLAGGSPGWPGTASPGAIGSLQGPSSLSMTSFTAATFAQTKFGSTKMKSHGATRPSRLSPTSAAISVAAVGADGCVTAPRISPTGPNSALVSNRGRWNHSPTAVMAPSPADRLSPMQQSSIQPGSTYAAQLSLAAAAAAATASTVGGSSYKGSQGLFDGNGLQDWMMIKQPSQQQQQPQQRQQQQQLHQYLMMEATAAASAPHLNQTLLAGSSSAFGGGGYQSTGSCIPHYYIGQTTPQPFHQADLSSKMTNNNSMGIGFGGDLPSGALTSSTSSVGYLFQPINASAFAEATGNGGFGSEASGGSIGLEMASLLGDDAISPLAANISQVDWSFVSSAMGAATAGNGASGSRMSVGNDGSGVGMAELHKLLLVN